MKIIDCFLYFNEDKILDIRLNILNSYVNTFVIAEFDLTFQGEKRKKNFNIKKFKKFKNKIKYFYIKTPKYLIEKLKNDQWVIEFYQRNYLKKLIKFCNKEDLIIVSDIDEIPNLHNINKFNFEKKIGVFIQKLFYYKMNLLVKTNKPWQGSRILKKKNLSSCQQLRFERISSSYIKNFFNKKLKPIYNGGWHFSYLMNPNKIKKKIQSFGHIEYNKSKYTEINYIKECIKNQKDLFGRNFFLKKIKFNKLNYPDYLYKNKKKFKGLYL